MKQRPLSWRVIVIGPPEEVDRRHIFFALDTSSSSDLLALTSSSSPRFLLLPEGTALALSDSVTSVPLIWGNTPGRKQKGLDNADNAYTSIAVGGASQIFAAGIYLQVSLSKIPKPFPLMT